MNSDKPANKLPNFTRRMLLMFAGQMMLVVVLFMWNDLFPSWLNRVMEASLILLPPLAYLTVLARPAMRQAWCNLLSDFWTLIGFATVAFFRLFRPATVKKLVQLVASLKPIPTSVDGWITFCVLPFKTCVVVTIPLIFVIEKFIYPFTSYRSSGREMEIIFESYLISLLGLLAGAVFQECFCRPGRARTTLKYFLFDFAVLFGLFYAPRLFSPF